MSTQRVPLVVYEDGVRKVIGEAVVDTDGNYMDMSAVITDKQYHQIVDQSISCLSLGHVEEKDLSDVKPSKKKGQRSRALRSLERRKHKRDR